MSGDRQKCLKQATAPLGPACARDAFRGEGVELDVHLHAIDAIPARWRGRDGSLALDAIDATPTKDAAPHVVARGSASDEDVLRSIRRH